MNKYVVYKGGPNSTTYLWSFLKGLKAHENIYSLQFTSDMGFFSLCAIIEANQPPHLAEKKVEFSIDNILKFLEVLSKKERIIEILYVDDERKQFEIFEQQYPSDGYGLFRPRYIKNKHELFETLGEIGDRPCIILLDIIWTKEDNGKTGSYAEEILISLNKDHPNIPVIMISLYDWFGQRKQQKIEDYWNKGAWGFIRKENLFKHTTDLLDILKTYADIDTLDLVVSIKSVPQQLNEKLIQIIEILAREDILIRNIYTLTPMEEILIVGYRANLRDINEIQKKEDYKDCKILKDRDVKMYRKEIFDNINYI